MIKNLTFEELKNDKTFIDGLRNEDFILILGAGFSYGIKNKSNATDTETIPLGGDFLKITNKKFNAEITKYPFAAGKWKTGYHETNDKQLKEEFKNLFLADEEAFDYERFERIFLPNWFKIYTLNFDNVLDLAQKNLFRKYPIYKYPKDVSNTRNSISHLHGKIETDFDFDDIVFSPTDYIESAKAKHNLYDPFHGDVHTFKKNIVIIGTQFDEDAVLSYFFDGLQNQDITIYHFELSNNNAREAEQFYKQNYHYIELSREKGVSEVFDFFEANRHKIQHYELEGAKVIDKDFIEALEAKTFLPKDFYISKLSDDCQWYGCLRGWGIKRELYNNLKETVISSFDQERISNLSAVVHGAGGCGKSTQLRILALELFNEKYKTVWVENFEAFNENSIAIIEKNNRQNFLVIIEDWYRLSDMYGNTVKEAFSKLIMLSNVRIVIGDRTLKKIYTNKLFNLAESTFEIFPAENKNIIQKVALKVPEWKVTCEAIYENDKIKNTSLFSVLFIIADIYNKNLPAEEIRFIDIKGHFADIVKSDVKKIAKKYPGLAKAIVYFANIYKEYKIRITKEALLTLAKHFNPSANFVLLDINSIDYEVDRLISNYISQTTISSKTEWINKLDFIQFNHDTLAEGGLSKSVLESWNSFDDQMQLFIVDTLMTNNEEYTISNYLSSLIKDDKSFFKNRQELKLAYIEKLFNKKNRQYSYLNDLLSIKSNYKYDVKKKYAINLLDRFQDNEDIFHNYISSSLKIVKGEQEGRSYAVSILNRFQNKEAISPEIISNCLTIVKGEKEGKSFAISILNRFQKKETISPDIISNCLTIVKGKKEGKSFAISILNRFQNKEAISPEIISNCLTIVKGEQEGKSFAISILNRFQKDETISKDIISNCLTIVKGEQEGKSFAISILNRFQNKEAISPEIINNCLTIVKGEQEGRSYAVSILNRFQKDESISKDIISNCLTIVKGEQEGKSFAISILNRFQNKEAISKDIISNCLTIVKGEQEGKSFAISILNRFQKDENISLDIISNCLTIVKGEKEGKGYAISILNRFKSEVKKTPEIILGKCLNVLKEDKRGLVYAKEILNNKNAYIAFESAFHSLHNYAFFKKDHECVANIINDYKKEENIKGAFYRYLKLFEVPFFYNKTWRSEAKYILLNWKKKDRELVSNVLSASQKKPAFSIKACKQILGNLLNELNSQSKNKEAKLDCIVSALKNPLLSDIHVKFNVKQLFLYHKENNILSRDQIKVLDKILEEVNSRK